MVEGLLKRIGKDRSSYVVGVAFAVVFMLLGTTVTSVIGSIVIGGATGIIAWLVSSAMIGAFWPPSE